MTKKAITVKDSSGKKIGININGFERRAINFLKKVDQLPNNQIVFNIIASETGIPVEEVNVTVLKEISRAINDTPYSEAFRNMLSSYLEKRLADRKYDLVSLHKGIYGKPPKEKMEDFINLVNEERTIKGMDIIKMHYFDGISLRQIAFIENRSPESVRVAKDEALRQIRIVASKKGLNSVFQI